LKFFRSCYMTQIAVLYDASYLMAKQAQPLHDHRLLKGYRITNIVADDTLREIRGHLAGNDRQKKERATWARGAIIRPEQAQNDRVRYREDSLAGIVPYDCQHIIGPDSNTDKRLITKAQFLVESGEFDAVVLASRDGGIVIGVNELR